MRLLKYFENFLNEEKLYKKLYSVVGYDDFIFIKYEVTGSLKKNLKDFDSLEIKQIKNLLYPKFNEPLATVVIGGLLPTPTDSKRLFFSEGDFSFEIFKDIDDYYYIRYDKKNTYQYFECDGKDGLMDFISDLKVGKFDYYFSRNMILVGSKTNLLKNMEERYQTEEFFGEIYYYDNGYHFGTLYKEGRFLELRHDGSLDENGRRKK
jgi:hypothetical protein